MKLNHKDFAQIDVELIPKYFCDYDLEADKEIQIVYRKLIQDVYPLMKLLYKFNSRQAQSDYSFRNVLTRKLSKA